MVSKKLRQQTEEHLILDEFEEDHLALSTCYWLIPVGPPDRDRLFNTPSLTKSFEHGSDPMFSWCSFAKIT